MLQEVSSLRQLLLAAAAACLMWVMVLWQIWTFWRSYRHCEEIPLRHTLLQPCWSDALSATTWTIHHSSHSAARRQVMRHLTSVNTVHCNSAFCV